MSASILERIKLDASRGVEPYDDITAFTAMMNRKAARGPADKVIEFTVPGIRAVIEGCCAFINATAAAAGDAAEAAAATTTSNNFDPARVVATGVNAILKSWQNSAMPAFISNIGPSSAAELGKLLTAISLGDAPTTDADSSEQQHGSRAAMAVALAGVQFDFAAKFVHETAAKALSDATVRLTRGTAQLAGVDAFLSIAAESPSARNAAEALDMALSAHMWLASLLKSQADESSTRSVEPDTEQMWQRCVFQCLQLLAPPKAEGVPLSRQEFEALPAGDKARYLVVLAQRGMPRAVPVAVLFRRVTSALGFSCGRPEFMLLVGLGLLSEAPATAQRDDAVQKLVDVYFNGKPAAPLQSQTELKAAVVKLVGDSLLTR